MAPFAWLAAFHYTCRPMIAILQRALFLLLVWILPVQSMAAVVLPIACAPGDAHHGPAVAHVGHDPADPQGGHAHGEPQHHAGPAHDHGHDGEQHAGDGHLCCHQFSSAGPSVHVLAAARDFRVYSATVSLLTPLHIPELPQRPPRA